jgi:hypothetical protein
MRGTAVAAALAGVVSVSSRAAAEAACSAPGRPMVELVLEVKPPDRVIGTTLEEHLRAELRARDIDVCTIPAPYPLSAAGPLPRPVARVTLHVEHAPSGAFFAVLMVGDLINDKRVERTIDLAHIPADGRPLAVAASTDELLRATWLELTLPDAPQPAIAPPAAITRAIATLRVRKASFVEASIVASADAFARRVGVGGGAWIGFWCLPRLSVEAGFLASVGLPRSSRDGSARADMLGPGAALVVALTEHDAPLGVRLEAHAEALRVHLMGTASAGATASQGDLWTGAAGATLRGWARIGPIAWTVGVGMIGALHAVAATDNGTVVTSVEGLGGRLDVGVASFFP